MLLGCPGMFISHTCQHRPVFVFLERTVNVQGQYELRCVCPQLDCSTCDTSAVFEPSLEVRGAYTMASNPVAAGTFVKFVNNPYCSRLPVRRQLVEHYSSRSHIRSAAIMTVMLRWHTAESRSSWPMVLAATCRLLCAGCLAAAQGQAAVSRAEVTYRYCVVQVHRRRQIQLVFGSSSIQRCLQQVWTAMPLSLHHKGQLPGSCQSQMHLLLQAHLVC